MASIVETYTVITKGKGAPDYSDTVSSAHQRAGIYLQYDQTLRMYGRSLNLGGDAEYPWIPSTPLAAGANTHFTDFETLTPMPVIIPAGYHLTLVSIGYTLSQDAQIYAYINLGVHIECMAATSGGIAEYENRVLGWSTEWIDADASDPHELDMKLYNRGTDPLFGQAVVVCILEAVGTSPLPTTKECTCPNCSNKQVESVHATKIKCKNCGHKYGVYDLTQFRRSL